MGAVGHFDASAGTGGWTASDSMEREARDPGWYRDPNDPRLHRYWDGRAWHAQRLDSVAPTSTGLPQPRPRTD